MNCFYFAIFIFLNFCKSFFKKKKAVNSKTIIKVMWFKLDQSFEIKGSVVDENKNG